MSRSPCVYIYTLVHMHAYIYIMHGYHCHMNLYIACANLILILYYVIRT